MYNVCDKLTLIAIVRANSVHYGYPLRITYILADLKTCMYNVCEESTSIVRAGTVHCGYPLRITYILS